MDDTSKLGDSIVPIYSFDWDDHESRTTEELPENDSDAVEALAALGRADESCDVELVGFTE